MPVDRENGSPPYIVNPVHGNKHSQSRALRIMARNQGWDPDVIVGTRSPEGVARVSVNISNWNKDPDVFWHDGVGVLPEGLVSTKENWPQSVAPNVGQGSPFGPQIESPDVSRENANRRTDGADPTPSMPGA